MLYLRFGNRAAFAFLRSVWKQASGTIFGGIECRRCHHTCDNLQRADLSPAIAATPPAIASLVAYFA